VDGTHRDVTATSVSTDTISEKTSAHGVTVDGMTIKDGLVVGGSDVGIDNTSLNTAAGKLGAAWQSWTPTMTNFTVGTGGSAGVTAKYIQVGKTVIYRIQGVLGTSGQSVGGSISFTLPVTATSVISGVDGTNYEVIGKGIIADNTTNVFEASLVKISTTAAKLVYSTVATQVQPLTATSASAPMVWAANDSFYIEGFYEAA
jgi:hypothetical protein